MRKLLILAAVGIGLFANSAHAKCLDGKMVDLIKQDFEFYDGNQPVDMQKLDLCHEESLINKTLSALSFLKKYSLLPMLPTTSGQLILGQDAWEYLKQRIQRIQLTANGVSLCGQDDKILNVVAYYEPRDPVATMHICKAFDTLDTFSAASILVHEARHTEGYGHVDCSRGRLNGEKIACDATYKLRGSYAVGVEYMVRLAGDNQVDPILRRSSRVAAATDLFERFNDAPMGLRWVSLMQADDGSVYGYDGHSFEKAGVGTPTQVMVDREGEPILFDAASGSVKTYALGQVSDTDGWLAARFREVGPSRTDFIDALYTFGYHCLLFEREMRCGRAEGPNFDVVVRFSKLHPVGFLYVSKSALVKEYTPYLVGDNGLLYPLPASHLDLAKLKEAKLKGRKTKKSILKLAPFSNDEQGDYVLTQDGHLLLFQKHDDGTRAFDEISTPEGVHFKSIAPPTIWSKDLRAL